MTSESLAQEEDDTYSCDLSKGAKIALGVTAGVIAVAALVWALLFASQQKKKQQAHTAVPSKQMDVDADEDLEEATAASESPSHQ